jgi:hypothetical protein
MLMKLRGKLSSSEPVNYEGRFKMPEISKRTDKRRVEKRAIRLGFRLRREATDHYSLIDDRTDQVAFEGTAVGTLEDIERILIEIMVFEHSGVDYGLGDTGPFGGITVDDETWKASTLHSSLIAASCKRTFVPPPGDAPQEGYLLISRAAYEAWVEGTFAILAPPGVFSKDEASAEALAHEDFASHNNFGSRVLAKRAGHDDGEILQGYTIVRLDDGRALMAFGSVGTISAMVISYGSDAFATDSPLHLDVQRALVARWLERVRAKPISLTHPVWALLPPSALKTYELLLVPQAPA